MSGHSSMQTTINAFFKLLEFLVVACMAAMVVMVFGNVVLRYGFNSGRLPMAQKISRALQEFDTFWHEDAIRSRTNGASKTTCKPVWAAWPCST